MGSGTDVKKVGSDPTSGIIIYMSPLKNKVVVITGAGRGVGKCLADTFAARGANVVASSLNSPSHTADVRKESDLQKLAVETVKEFGRIDIWINNAGVWLPRTPVEKLDMREVHELFEVNFFGAVHGCRAALAVMKKQGEKGSGTIVNIVSTAALIGRPFTAAYAASKHAEKGFIDSLRIELAEEGSDINVIGMYPGGIKTAIFGAEKPEGFEQFMEPEFVAEAVAANLEKERPDTEIILRRAGQNIKT